jgi:hypothetical protein
MLSIPARRNVHHLSQSESRETALLHPAGLISGYVLLISAGVFLVYVLSAAIRVQLYDTIVAYMVAVVAGYCLVGTLMVVLALRRSGDQTVELNPIRIRPDPERE